MKLNKKILFAAALAVSLIALPVSVVKADNDVKPKKVSVTPKKIEVTAGQEFELKAKLTPKDAEEDYLVWSIVKGKNVIAFDEGEVILETEMGTLSIKGEGLQIKRLDLDKKEADIEGRMDSFGYSEKKGFGTKGESFWSRLFR